MLLGTGAHPLMDPAEETRIWAHGGGEIYATYDRIFGCKGHGWSNLQSTHLNLPFATTRSSAGCMPPSAWCCRSSRRWPPARHSSTALHRLPGRAPRDLSPQPGAHSLDHRQGHPRAAVQRGGLPRPVRRASPPTSRRTIPDGVLNPLFLNSRGAIARFDRNAIEIRTIDIQECPAADLGRDRGGGRAVLRRLVAEQACPTACSRSGRRTCSPTSC
jgi:glutamate---cysteine ligase / carboxylate-amine ligase